jgi:hypothetical protein
MNFGDFINAVCDRSPFDVTEVYDRVNFTELFDTIRDKKARAFCVGTTAWGAILDDRVSYRRLVLNDNHEDLMKGCIGTLDGIPVVTSIYIHPLLQPQIRDILIVLWADGTLTTYHKLD